jgi:hypothetical protein
MMHAVQFIACCVFAVVCIGTLHSLSSTRNENNSEDPIKRFLKTSSEDAVSNVATPNAERSLNTGIGSVVWVVTLTGGSSNQLPGTADREDISVTMCKQGNTEMKLEEYMLVGARIIGKARMKKFSTDHNINIARLTWEIEMIEERRRMMEEAPTEQEEAHRNLQGYWHKARYSGSCTYCDPDDDDRRRRLAAGGVSNGKKKVLSDHISEFLENKVRTFCLPDLDTLTFERENEKR